MKDTELNENLMFFSQHYYNQNNKPEDIYIAFAHPKTVSDFAEKCENGIIHIFTESIRLRKVRIHTCSNEQLDEQPITIYDFKNNILLSEKKIIIPRDKENYGRKFYSFSVNKKFTEFIFKFSLINKEHVKITFFYNYY